jgi:hypothetical protein
MGRLRCAPDRVSDTGVTKRTGGHERDPDVRASAHLEEMLQPRRALQTILAAVRLG